MGGPSELLGRDSELAVLSGIADAVREGESRALILHGPAGIGKTALLEGFRDGVDGVEVYTATGVESELDFSWAGLHQLCRRMLRSLDRIPEAQQQTLRTAFGLAVGSEPDPFRAGLAVLSLLSEVSEQTPVLCVVDDVHALDRLSAQTLAFVARRLQHESVGLVFAGRTIPPEFERIPDLQVRGLTPTTSGRVLDSVLSVLLDPAVRRRILAEAAGNPLALTEMGRDGASITDLAGGYGAALDPQSRVEASFLRTAKSVAQEYRTVMLLASAEPTGDLALLRRAAASVGIDLPSSDEPFAGLMSLGTQVRFRHPLVRSTIYRAASESDRRAAHRALASAYVGGDEPDRQIWHVAQGVDRPDEGVARSLIAAAETATRRGGYPAAAAFLHRAAELTPDSLTRAEREIDAAMVFIQILEPRRALDLIETAESRGLGELSQAEAVLLRGQDAFYSDERRRETVGFLLDAAQRFEGSAPDRAQAIRLQAVTVALQHAPFEPDLVEAAIGAVARDRDIRGGRASGVGDHLSDALRLLATEGVAAATPAARRTVAAFIDEGLSAAEMPVVMQYAPFNLAMDTFDFDAMLVLAEQNVAAAREIGSVALLPSLLEQLAGARILTGDFEATRRLVAEADALALPGWLSFVRLALLAWRDELDAFTRGADPLKQAGEAYGMGYLVVWVETNRALMLNAQRQHRDALDLAASLTTTGSPHFMTLLAWEYAESASRAGDDEEIARAVAYLQRLTGAGDTEWSRGVRLVADALLGAGSASATEGRFLAGIDALDRAGLLSYSARGRLLFGEWLRRQGRRADSRVPLGAAHRFFTERDLTAFAARAAVELGTSASAKAGRVGDRDELTLQEREVAELASSGLTNREIAARLFLSPRTVGSHLYRVFPKLGITSRNQLHAALAKKYPRTPER